MASRDSAAPGWNHGSAMRQQSGVAKERVSECSVPSDGQERAQPLVAARLEQSAVPPSGRTSCLRLWKLMTLKGFQEGKKLTLFEFVI